MASHWERWLLWEFLDFGECPIGPIMSYIHVYPCHSLPSISHTRQNASIRMGLVYCWVLLSTTLQGTHLHWTFAQVWSFMFFHPTKHQASCWRQCFLLDPNGYTRNLFELEKVTLARLVPKGNTHNLIRLGNDTIVLRIMLNTSYCYGNVAFSSCWIERCLYYASQHAWTF